MQMRNMAEPYPGLELGGLVRLVEKLGEGGMGSVWTAEHLALRTNVAVKFLASHMVRDPSAAARFRREATAAARIRSPHVVQIFDHGVSDHFGPYIVMELLEGQSLATFIERRGKLDPATTADIVGQLCKALGKAHALGIVHRDIKPDNVYLIDPEREPFVKVLDFGIAKNQSDELNVTSTGTMMGTPHYMSPEQMLSSKHVDLRSDLWAVGILTYHCLTGGVPFDGETFGAIAIAIAHGEFKAPLAGHGVGSVALDTWFRRALARDPGGRFASAEELAIALHAAVADHAVGAVTADASRTALLHATSRVASSADLEGRASQHQPTFTGVAQTLPGPRPSKVYALAGAAAAILLGVVGVAVVLTRGPSAPAGASSERPFPAAPSVAPAPTSPMATAIANPSPPAVTSTPTPVPPLASVLAPASSTSAARQVQAAPRPRPRPIATAPQAAPATAPGRADRGF